MDHGFWSKLDKPIFGLSPMDGVTDGAMRYITKKYGKPQVLFTEFTSAEGVRAGATRLMKDFYFDESERPIVAQIFGSDPDAFHRTAMVVAALGFDGVDINMGCPAKSVEERGAGAALINTPRVAGQIVAAVKMGIEDWSSGKKLEDFVSEEIVEHVKRRNPNPEKKNIPVSIKTRIGVDTPVTEDWMHQLVEFKPANISLHGRTLKQLYSGEANWEEIGKAAKIVKTAGICFLGNGDIISFNDAIEKINTYGLDGVLVGRSAQGNPWFFTGKEIKLKEKLLVAIEHARYFEKVFPDSHFLPMRKHLAWYARGFENASDLRGLLVQASSAAEAERMINEWLEKSPRV